MGLPEVWLPQTSVVRAGRLGPFVFWGSGGRGEQGWRSGRAWRAQQRVTKRYDEPIEVTPDPVQGGAPLSFEWRGCRYDVDQWLMTWREAGEWWRRNGKASSSNGSVRSTEATGTESGVREREFFRVLARPSGALASGDLDSDGFMQHPGAVYDVYLDRVQRRWRLARVWD